MHKDWFKSSRNIRWEYTDKPVSPWGGMRLMKAALDQLGIREQIETLDIPQPGSNRGYSPIIIIESFFVSVWLGASKFTHTAMVRFDSVLPKIFGWKSVPSQSTFSRFFNKFSWKRNDSVFPVFNQWFFSQLRLDNLTLDLDSTVITRYGNQEGSARGYNPRKPGRSSHHPLIAFLSETRMVVNSWLRPGNTGATSNFKHFLDETFSILSSKKIGLVRADSGFFGNRFLSDLERRKLSYIVACKMNPVLKLKIKDHRQWTVLSDGVQVGEFYYRASSWKHPRRIVVIRQDSHRRPKSTGKTLFPELENMPIYRYSAFVTNLELPASQIWFMYKGRADSENRIKELKYDFGMDSFNLQKFYATEAAFRFILIAYNVMSLFRQLVLSKKSQAMLSTIRFQCFAIGSWIVKDGRERVLKLSVTRKKRAWMDGLFSKAKNISPPFLESVQLSNA